MRSQEVAHGKIPADKRDGKDAATNWLAMCKRVLKERETSEFKQKFCMKNLAEP